MVSQDKVEVHAPRQKSTTKALMPDNQENAASVMPFLGENDRKPSTREVQYRSVESYRSSGPKIVAIFGSRRFDVQASTT